jgi:hypothetical protein
MTGRLACQNAGFLLDLRGKLVLSVGLFVLMLGAPRASADTIDGTINFTVTVKHNCCYTYTGPAPTASFVYDNTSDTFSAFEVEWAGDVFDFTSLANSITDPSAPPSSTLSTPGAAFYYALTNASDPTWCGGAPVTRTAQSGCGVAGGGWTFYIETGLLLLNPAVTGMTGPSKYFGQNEGGTYTVSTADVTTSPHTVPEPSTLLLTGICFLGLLTRSFWRRYSL